MGRTKKLLVLLLILALFMGLSVAFLCVKFFPSKNGLTYKL